jgi:hypothetical protein
MKLVECPCGERIEAAADEELVDAVNAHLDAEHPNVAGHYSPEQILMMAREA